MYTSSLKDWYKKRNKPIIKFDYDYVILNDEEDYITVWIDGKPVWHEVYYDSQGSFIDKDFTKYYLPKSLRN